MKEIKLLAELMRDELDDSCKYAKLALEYKDKDREMGELFSSLSKEEMNHADREHDQAVRLIRSYTGQVPVAMQAVWDWEHGLLIEKKMSIKQLQQMYKE